VSTATLFPDYTSDACLSECGRYRYWLTRTWDASKPPVCWIMLNPSTADARQDDPTIRRCIGFARAWGAGGIVVVNLFALRATDPGKLKEHYPVLTSEERRNDSHILAACANAGRIIAAWGCDGTLRGRDADVTKMLAQYPVECMGVTKEGHPKHPLYLASKTVPVSFRPSAAPSAGRSAKGAGE
jgi:hypothetical protein